MPVLFANYYCIDALSINTQKDKMIEEPQKHKNTEILGINVLAPIL